MGKNIGFGKIDLDRAKPSATADITDLTRRRYNRRAFTYDLMELFPERVLFGKWRKLAWSKVEGANILEVGVGTGKNLPYYTAGARSTAIDLSGRMLARARSKTRKLGLSIDLREMDVQKMDFPDNSFDTVIATFVFCSVPDPLLGLAEIKRVCKPGGRIVLLEHVLSDNPGLAWLMNRVNPIMVRLMGANINRRTVENVARSGFTGLQVKKLNPIFRLIQATKA